MRRRATLIFLVGDASTFAALFAVYIYLRHSTQSWPHPFHFPSLLMAGAMSMFALCASFTMAMAQRRPADIIAVRLVIVTLGAWLIFLFLETFEWVRLVWIEQVTLQSPFGETFFSLIGLHLLHVLAGFIWLMVVAANIRKADTGASALYVHFVNGVWLVLFIGVYLTSADLQDL